METQYLKDPISNFTVSSQQQISSTTCKLLAKSSQLSQRTPILLLDFYTSKLKSCCPVSPAHVPHCCSTPRLCSPCCPSITHALWWSYIPLNYAVENSPCPSSELSSNSLLTTRISQKHLGCFVLSFETNEHNKVLGSKSSCLKS